MYGEEALGVEVAGAEGDLLHGLDGGGTRVQPVGDVALHVLDHHDGVVHHDADRQHDQSDLHRQPDREPEDDVEPDEEEYLQGDKQAAQSAGAATTAAAVVPTPQG